MSPNKFSTILRNMFNSLETGGFDDKSEPFVYAPHFIISGDETFLILQTLICQV